MDILLIGWCEISGRQHPPPSASNPSGVSVLVGSLLSLTFNFSHLVGYLQNSSKILCASPDGKPEPCPRPALLFLLAVTSLSLSLESACNAGDPGSIPGLGRAPGEENGKQLQYSCQENPHRQKRTWWATVHEVPKIQTQLSN